MSTEKKLTAAEHRAFLEGGYSVIKAFKDEAAQLWAAGRDSFDLDRLRDELLAHEVRLADHGRKALALEAKLDGHGECQDCDALIEVHRDENKGTHCHCGEDWPCHIFEDALKERA